MGMVGEACLPSNTYYPRTPDYTLYSGVYVCWSEYSDSSFVYGFMSLVYGLGTMTATTVRICPKTRFRLARPPCNYSIAKNVTGCDGKGRGLGREVCCKFSCFLVHRRDQTMAGVFYILFCSVFSKDPCFKIITLSVD